MPNKDNFIQSFRAVLFSNFQYHHFSRDDHLQACMHLNLQKIPSLPVVLNGEFPLVKSRRAIELYLRRRRRGRRMASRRRLVGLARVDDPQGHAEDRRRIALQVQASGRTGCIPAGSQLITPPNMEVA
jgi:hypothetical protein